MAPQMFVPSRAPTHIAWITGLALLFCNKTAPLLLSPQTGWHFAATACWVWLAFAAAGAAKGLLLTLALLRLAAGPAASLQAGGRLGTEKGSPAKKSGSAAKCTGDRDGDGSGKGAVERKAAASGKGSAAAPPHAAQSTAAPTAANSLSPAAVQTLLLRILAVLAFIAASAAAAAQPLTRKLGAYVHAHKVLIWLVGSSGGPRTAEILAAAGLGPLFWALGAAFAISTAQSQLSGGGRGFFRRATAASAAGVIVLAAAMEKAGSVLAGMLPVSAANYLARTQALWYAYGPVLPLPSQPVLHVFGCVAVIFGLQAVSAPLWTAGGQPVTSLKQAAAQKKQQAAQRHRQLLRRGLWGLLRLALVPWLAVIGHQLWQQRLVAGGTIPKFRTQDNEFAILHRQEGVLGEMFAVVQGDHSRARFVCLKAGHSILGGRYSMPKYYANQSIYDVFYIHEGAWLMQSNAEASLHIGLGIGKTASAFAERGLRTDVIELHPEVPVLAERFFDWQKNGSVATADAGKVVDDLLKLDPRPEYDIIIHDVFSGGAVPARLFTAHFLIKLRALLAPGGILTVNFYGDPAAQPARDLAKLLFRMFGNLRAWGEGAPSDTRNIVFFASAQPLRLRLPTKEDDLRDGGRSAALERYFVAKHEEDETPPEDDGTPVNNKELDLSWLRPHLEPGPTPPMDKRVFQEMIATPLRIDGGKLTAADEAAAALHWKVMRTVMGQTSFWDETY